MRIIRIVDSNDYKLILAENVITYRQPNCRVYRGYKHSGTGTVFFDFKDNVLRRFYGSRFDIINVQSYKAALKHIFSL